MSNVGPPSSTNALILKNMQEVTRKCSLQTVNSMPEVNYYLTYNPAVNICSPAVSYHAQAGHIYYPQSSADACDAAFNHYNFDKLQKSNYIAGSPSHSFLPDILPQPIYISSPAIHTCDLQPSTSVDLKPHVHLSPYTTVASMDSLGNAGTNSNNIRELCGNNVCKDSPKSSTASCVVQPCSFHSTSKNFSSASGLTDEQLLLAAHHYTLNKESSDLNQLFSPFRYSKTISCNDISPNSTKITWSLNHLNGNDGDTIIDYKNGSKRFHETTNISFEGKKVNKMPKFASTNHLFNQVAPLYWQLLFDFF